MDEDVGVKAPVTRLRRRLSVESDDVKSPSGPATPTKKRGGRLAAKPQLDLIAEATENIPKKSTRKTAVKDVSSIDPGDDVPVTPSRRSARIRSNTSIVSEVTQSYDSPRAKRAARRTSQAGSDNETPLTPAIQTRRTRKDSTSSIDKQDDTTISNKIVQVADVIVEETEAIDDIGKNNATVRKSPRLSQKKDVSAAIITTPKDKSDNHGMKDDKQMDVPANNDTSKTSDEITQSTQPAVLMSPMNVDLRKNTISEIKNIHYDNFSSDNSSDKLIIDLDRKPKKKHSVINKSTSALEDTNYSKGKRHRTKSCSTISGTNSKDDKFYSDNEVTIKKKGDKSLNLFDTGFGDGTLINLKISKDKGNKTNKENNKSLNLSNTNKNGNSIMVSTNEAINKSIECNKSSQVAPNTISMSQENNEIASQSSQVSNDSSSVTKLLENAPSSNLKSLVLIDEDSDSNSETIGIIRRAKEYDGEDQCVPVAEEHKQIEEKDQINCNVSYEPMDVDETMPQNISITDFPENKSTNKLDELAITQNASICTPTKTKKSNDTTNKSKRKSSLSHYESQNLEKSSDENKSTLILSQIKDTTSNEFNIVSKSPKDTITNEPIYSSTKGQEPAEDKEKYNKNVSLSYLTSTPLQQKVNKKIGMQIDTSIISPKNDTHKDTKDPISIFSNMKENSPNKPAPTNDKNLSLKEKSKINDEQDNESSADESSNEPNNFIDNEAEEASADYESGDSQDSEERQFQKENEILDKGETLDTDDNYSEDTDYEKDSFIVSSDEEDQELLSGSGDDLSMSDNELSMSAKSKKKFNDRKMKDQKEASREMYQARHKFNDSDRSSKSDKSKTKKNKRQRLDSTSDSDEEIVEQPKKNNRLRIDSSQDISICKSDADESVTKKKKKSKRLSESLCNDIVMNENEITILNESVNEKVNPLSMLVKEEPKTPQKDLNISTVLITDNLEEVKIDENVSMMKANETTDPLQATIANEESDTSSSGNEEIIENYDSMLSKLNFKQIKSKDMSLNAIKKKKTVKEPIFDQLNLTNVKTPQKKQKSNAGIGRNSIETSEDVHALDKSKISSDDDAASDSIDMRLLFPEDSNESDVNNKNQNNDNSVNPQPNFIPLQKTEAQTNIRDSFDTTSGTNNKSVQNLSNISKNKNNKRESSQYTPEDITSTNIHEDTNNFDFFIDTLGTRLEAPMNISLTSSAKKKKNKNNSIIMDQDTEEKPVEILYSSEQKKIKSKRSLDKSKSDAGIYGDIVQVEVPLMNTVTTSEKKLKKNKKDGMTQNNSHRELTQTIVKDCYEDSDNPHFIIDTVGMQAELTTSINTSVTHSAKKKKKNKDPKLAEDMPVDILYSSEKKNKKSKHSLDKTQTEAAIGNELAEEMPADKSYSSQKKTKKSKHSLDITETEAAIDHDFAGEMPADISYSSQKKTKKSKHSLDKTQTEAAIDYDHAEAMPADISYSSEKKTKKSKHSLDNSQTEAAIDHDLAGEMPADISYSSQKKTKKSKHSLDKTQTEAAIDYDHAEAMPADISYSSQKKTKKSKCSLDNTQTEAAIDHDLSGEIPADISYSSQKKTKKSKHSLDNTQTEAAIDHDLGGEIPADISYSSQKKTKKSKHSLNNTQTKAAIDHEIAGEIPADISYSSQKKTKNSKHSLDNTQIEAADNNFAEEMAVKILYSSEKKNKKSKKSYDHIKNEAAVDAKNLENFQPIDAELKNTDITFGKNIKDKLSLNNTVNELKILSSEEIDSDEAPIEISYHNDKKKKKEETDVQDEEHIGVSRKKRKRKASANSHIEVVPTEDKVNNSKSSKSLDESVSVGSQKKKRKISDNRDVTGHEQEPVNKRNKKRKERDDDDSAKISKVFKENSLDKIHVPRLPSHILNQLDDKPKQVKVGNVKLQAISTTNFSVEDAKIRRNKPSNYLEDSVYLNDSPIMKKQKKTLKKPKVLPFMPTASTSDSGFTTNFRINLLPRELQHIAHSNDMINFKNDVLQRHKVKKFDTCPKYKNKNRDKIDKF